MKKFKLIITGAISLFSIAAASSIAVVTSNITNNSSIQIVDNNKNSTEENYPLYKAQSNGQNSFLSTKNGPLVYWNNKITSLDWFGAKRWEINMEDHFKLDNYGGSWKRAWYNWDYDRTRNILWVLSGQYSKSKYQTVFSFNADTGEKTGEYPITQEVDSNYTKADYRFISALSSGKVLVYGGATLPSYDGTAILFDPATKKGQKITGDSGKIDKPQHNEKETKMYLFNIIPISNGKNIVEYAYIDTRSGTQGDQGADRGATYDVYFTLVDDNLNMITKSGNDFWSKSNKVVDGVQGYRNSTITPQRDYYFLLDGRIVTILYNTVVIINPNDNSVSNKTSTKVSYQTYGLDKTKWILSWTFDTDENLFFKYKNDDKVLRVKASDLKNNGFFDSTLTLSPVTYYDLSGASEDVRKYASSYVLYNVYGYSGQIMLVNAWYSDYINIYGSPNDTDAEKQQYGLAVAITQNEKQVTQGDSKGCLNGPNSFQRSADFDISQEKIKTKLPSEITRNDVEITNGGFFTSNSTKGNDGKLLYPPFTISNIKDQEGTFTVTAYIDQIPWFATKLPSDAVPKKIIKSFTNGEKIQNKISWKDEKSLSYDFKNTLPSKLSIEDVNNFDPFQVSFNSKTVLGSNGEVLYPKKTYEIGSRTDKTGQVVINVKYDYLPQGVDYIGNESILSYSTNKTYTIFSSETQKHFYFAGATDEASNANQKQIDINTVPQLKALSESNMLPSSFKVDDKNTFLQFINTNKSQGYPISKINFSVEPNDELGTLKVTAKVDRSYDENAPTFIQTFVGFNKKTNYSFSFNKDKNSINNKNFSNILASSINDGDVVNELIQYTGFNSSDFTINLYPNDDNGTLQVDVLLKNNYAPILGNSNEFTNYKASFTFSGFMTTETYNNQYNITFRDDSDINLLELKKMTLSSIDDGLKNKSLHVGDETYTSLNDLVYKLFIKEKGSKIPTNWNDNSNIQTKMSFDNQAGTLNISITIKQTVLDGYDSDLNYVISYSGFTKGNIVVTKDNLSFVDQKLLLEVVPELRGKTPTQMKEWLNNNSTNLRKILFSVTGQYDTLITSNEYTLEMDANDAYGIISITIKFENLNDDKSLKQYSIQYYL